MSATNVLPRHEMSQCYGCGLEVVQPKLLPCLHTFCLRCLELGDQRPDRSSRGRGMSCPKCSTEFVVPPQGLRGLRTDIFAERLVKMQKGLCDVCSDEQGHDDASVPPASKYCSLCCQGLCERCSVEHSRQKLLKAHPLVEFSVETALEHTRLYPSNLCVKHPTVLSMQFFCFICQRFVCIRCLLEGHMQHEWSKWEEVADQFRGHLQRSIDQVSGLLSDAIKSRQEVVDKERRLFSSKTEEIEFQIRKRCQELKNVIDRHEKTLLDELESTREARLRKIDEEINKKFERHLVQLETFKNYCTSVKDFGSPTEIDWAVNDLNLGERSEELKTQCDNFADTDPHLSSFTEISFKVPDDDDGLNNCSFIGKVTSQANLSMDPSADPLDCEVLYIGAASQRERLNTRGKEAWGVTWLDNYIYVLTEESVLVFNPEYPSSPAKQIDIPDKKYLTDIAASPIDRCLYVTDQGEENASIKESCIWRIAIEPKRDRVSKWLTAAYKLFTLSVSSKGHVVVPMSSKKLNTLKTYSVDSSPIKIINLPRKIIFPNHVIELANGNFVVAFGKFDKHGVCEINSSGEIVSSFGDDHLLNHPWHLAVFANENLLLADSKNDRVLWLNSRLDLKEVLLTKEKDGIIEPRRMCYVKQNNLLMVVHSEDRKRVVDVYDGDRWLL